VEEVELERTLELSYRVPAFQQCVLHPTRVRFELRDVDGGTELTLTHSEFLEGAEWDSYYAGHRACWDVDLKKLRALVEDESVGPVLRIEIPIEGDLDFERLERCLIAVDRPEAMESRGDELSYRIQRDARRARVDVLREGAAVIITEAFEGEGSVRESEQYARWQSALAGFGPLESGTPYDY